MIFERALLGLYSRRLLPDAGRRMVQRRAWTVARGAGAGMRLRFPQNPDYLLGVSEVPVQQALTAHLRPGAVFFDVGANVGFLSLIAARLVGPAGRVHAFEPVAGNASAVRANARLNRLDIAVHEVAVGGRARIEDLLITDWDGGAALATSVVKPAAPSATCTARVVSLDEFIAAEGLPKPTFVKIDVEGAEREVLEGARRTLSECRPALLYEVDDGDAERFACRWAELDQYVSGFGYRVSHLDDSYANRNWHVGHSLALPA